MEFSLSRLLRPTGATHFGQTDFAQIFVLKC